MGRGSVAVKARGAMRGGPLLPFVPFVAAYLRFRTANAGVPEELRQELAGHSSRESHKTYTHYEAERLRSAVASIGWNF